MYLIIYQKRNGDTFERKRATLPNTKIGSETSMGWIVKDIKYQVGNKYYSSYDYMKHKRTDKFKRNIILNFDRFTRRYAKYVIIIFVFPLYDYLKTILQ